MIAARAFHGRNVAVFGLGGSGVATARALVEGGANVAAFDDNPDRVAEAAGAGIAVADLRAVDWRGQAALVLAPGVPLTHPRPHWIVDVARAGDVPVIGDVELLVRERRATAPDCPFVAVTGTNGKSTTTALIAHILREAGRDTQCGGNIGTPVMLLDPPRPGRFYVIECSSYQIDLAPSIDPTAGILLNLSPDHLDRHGAMESYAAIKERLVAGSGLAIVGVDDRWCTAIADRIGLASRRVTRISRRKPLADGFYGDNGRIVLASGGVARQVADLTGVTALRGDHNAQNAAAAVAACIAVGLSENEVRHGLSSFPGLVHRMQPVAHCGRVLFVNDSKATNIDAAGQALASFSPVYWIAGGLPKETDLRPLAPWYARIARAYLIGEAAPAFAAALSGRVPYEIAGTLDRAVVRAAAAATAAAEGGGPGPVVLLSPACAAFDQFRNFAVRGDAFKARVAALTNVTMIA